MVFHGFSIVFHGFSIVFQVFYGFSMVFPWFSKVGGPLWRGRRHREGSTDVGDGHHAVAWIFP